MTRSRSATSWESWTSTQVAGSVLGLRAYFALISMLMLGGFALWLRGDRAKKAFNSF